MELPPTWVMLVSSSIMGLITRYQAKKQGKNPLFWFWIGFLFGGLGIFAFFLTKKTNASSKPTPIHLFPKVNLHLGPWYYAENQTILGPFSRDYIQKLLDENRINLSTLVWHDSMPEWEKLEKFTEK